MIVTTITIAAITASGLALAFAGLMAWKWRGLILAHTFEFLGGL